MAKSLSLSLSLSHNHIKLEHGSFYDPWISMIVALESNINDFEIEHSLSVKEVVVSRI